MPTRTTNDSDDDIDNIHNKPNPDTTGSSVPSPTAQRYNDDPDTCRILLSTDNHLGYAERDSIRGMDSFAAFEEVLYLGQLYHVDLILLAGDVFHDNRPSRRTIYTTMEIVRRYCMGPNPIRIQIISDPDSLKSSLRSSSVNYLDPNYSVHLPIFAIHGNHDDPSRDQGSGELLAALDLFAVTNLINYFGRQEEVDQIQISPILIQKGITKVALYGLGSLRDERLNRMWEKQKVVFLRPEDDADEDENHLVVNEDDDDEFLTNNGNKDKGFFNIFALHQNRDLGRGTKNCIQESMIPEWMDVVVWGHEHECLIEFFESLVGTFRITQPGSSVATSLVPGEAVQKKIGILDVKGRKYRLHPVPLTQVRTFVMTEISLREHRSNLDPNDPKVDEKLNKLLEEEVQLMIMSARDKAREQLIAAQTAGNDAADMGNTTLKHKLHRPEDVLVRLRVDHVGYATINNQRFGAKFVGQVANPTDVLLFHRKKDPKLASVVKKQGLKPTAPEALERANMEDLVREQLVSDGKLNIYGEQDLSEALEEFVDKSGMVATIADIAADKLSATQKQLIKGKQGEEPLRNDSQVLEVLERDSASKVGVDNPPIPNSSSKRSHAADYNNMAANDTLQDEAEKVEPSVRKRKAAKVAAPQHSIASLDNSDEEDIVENTKTTTTRSFQQAPATTRPKRTGTKSKVAYALDDSDDDEYISDAIVDSDDDEIDDDNEEEAVTARGTNRKKAPPQKGRKATVKTTKKAAVSTAKSSGKRSRLTDFDDSDDEVENNRNASDSADIDTDWGTAKTRTQRSQW